MADYSVFDDQIKVNDLHHLGCDDVVAELARIHSFTVPEKDGREAPEYLVDVEVELRVAGATKRTAEEIRRAR